MMTSKLLWSGVLLFTLTAFSATRQSSSQAPTRESEPIIVSADGDVQLTPADEGVYFDMDSKGSPKKTAWTLGGREDSFIVIDENHNGRIDNGSEVIGGGPVGPPNGFEYLKAYDGFARGRATKDRQAFLDGMIDEQDEIFRRLILWTDRNHNGISEEDELQSVAYAGIRSIDLREPDTRENRDVHGNVLKHRAVALGSMGSRHLYTVKLRRVG